ncbi:p285L [African swine fever virus]|nr:p285L [African swine fever virus]WPS70981.1 p285L [African swine fever virus]WQY95877.1 p285L [African swine fever virus]
MLLEEVILIALILIWIAIVLYSTIQIKIKPFSSSVSHKCGCGHHASNESPRPGFHRCEYDHPRFERTYSCNRHSCISCCSPHQTCLRFQSYHRV